MSPRIDDQLVELSIESLAKKFEQHGLTDDPVRWVRTVLNEYIWSKQEEVLESVRLNRKTAVRACHGVGKSFIASRAVLWWLSTHADDDALVITTAPTAAQVTGIIWQEIKKAHSRAGLPGTVTGGSVPQWKVDGVIKGEGRSPSDSNQHSFQGRHAKYLFIVVDEACGIAPLIWDGVESMATGPLNRMLAIGNPTDPNTKFRDMFKPESDWNEIHIDALKSPNMCQSELDKLHWDDQANVMRVLQKEGIELSTEVVPDGVRENITSIQWVAEKIKTWGVDSALWKGKVRGEFPDSSDMGVIPLPWVEAAIRRWEAWDEKGRPPIVGRSIVGCDVARMGEDKTCFAVRVADCITDIFTYQHADTMVTSDVLLGRGRMVDLDGREIVLPPWQTTPFMQYVVDSIGVGAGVKDRLRQYFREHPQMYTPEVIGFNASKGTSVVIDDFAFFNQRAYAWWRMRKLLDPAQNNGRGSSVMLPPHDEMIRDLTTPKWTPADTGKPPKIKIESKEDIRKRLSRSPDVADAIIMAFLPDGMAVSHSDDFEPTQRDEGTKMDLSAEESYDTPDHSELDGFEDVLTWEEDHWR